VAYKDADGKLEDVVDGELTWDVHKDESMWSLVPENIFMLVTSVLYHFYGYVEWLFNT